VDVVEGGGSVEIRPAEPGPVIGGDEAIEKGI